ncbi:MAG TPA: ABC transporter substrate-binding protein [Thermomicrobiaceae bacterium]|nr:ABC transporter substrate-binding protein [Thermomicrobiaceae bacterium]
MPQQLTLREQHLLSRRRFLKLSGFLGGGVLLAACGGSASSPTAASTSSSGGASTATSAPSAAGTGTSASAAGSPAATGFASNYSQTFVINPSSASTKLASDQSFRYMYTEPVHLDPGLATSGNEVYLIYEIWEGLVRYDNAGKVIPLGATNWDVSPDGTVYTFHLRDGVKWTDGTPITAHDYVWTWTRNLDPKTASEYAEALYSIKNAQAFNGGKITDASQLGLKALDDKTFQVTLEGPAGYFLRIASTWTGMPLPKQTIEKNAEKWVEAANVISNGPFKMTEWNHDQQITLERNDGYWGDKPTLQKATIKIVTDFATSSLQGYENDELDWAIGPWPADMDRIKKDAKLSKELHVVPGSQTYFVVCDSTNTGSPIGKSDVRKALYLALDRQQIVEKVFQGLYIPAYTILPDDILGHNPNARIQGTVKDAQDLMSKAGYPGGKGVTLTMPFPQTATNNLLAQVLQQMWQTNLGITVTLQPTESKAFTALRKTFTTGHFDFYFSAWGSDYLDPFDWMNFLFTTGTDFYHAHWSNQQFDQLCAKAATLQDQGQRADLYAQAEALLVGDAAYIPLYHTATPYLIKPWVLDYVYQATGGRPWVNLKIAQH